MTNRENEIEKQLLAKRVGTLWKGTFTSSVVGFSAALFIYFYIRETADAFLINSWIVSVFIFSIIRFAVALVYKKNPDKFSLEQWDKMHFYLACTVATFWGAGTYFLGNVPTEKEVVVAATLLGISSGGAISNIANRWTAMYYSGFLVFCYIIRVITLDRPNVFLFGCVMFFYIFLLGRMISLFSRMYEESNKMAIELQDKIELEKELQKEKVNAFQSSKMASLGEMAAGIAHEINNPLTVSLGKIRILKRLLKNENDKVLKAINSIESSNVRISEIVFSMRSLSRMSDKAVLEVLTPSHLMGIVQPIIAAKLKWHDIFFDVDMKPDDLMGNKGEISQVVLNLIQNGIDAMMEQKERWINITGASQDGFYIIKVVNHGAGIPDDVADRLFEPFFTTKEIGKGTGLGLSLSKTLMERSKGAITYVKDAPNTTFELKIPLA